MRNLLTCPCCNSIPEFKYRAKSELHCTWDDEQYFLPKGWEYSHFCPVDNGLQTSGGVGFQTLHDAQRDWNCKVGSFLRNPLNSFHSSIETGAELLTELDDCFVGQRIQLGDRILLSRRSLTVRGIVQFIQRGQCWRNQRHPAGYGHHQVCDLFAGLGASEVHVLVLYRKANALDKKAERLLCDAYHRGCLAEIDENNQEAAMSLMCCAVKPPALAGGYKALSFLPFCLTFVKILI